MMLQALKMEKEMNKSVAIMEYLNGYLEDFLYDCKMRSKATYDNYKSDFNKIAKQMFNKSEYKYLTKQDFESLTIDDLIFYFKSLSQEEKEDGSRLYSNQTINRQLSSFKSLVKYLSARSAIDFPVNKMMVLLKSLPKNPEHIDVFTVEQTQQCINFLSEIPSGKSLSLISKLSVDTALRASELLNLTWNQFYIQDDSVAIKSSNKNKGKGNKEFRKVISNELYSELLQLKQEGIERVFNISYTTLSQAMLKAIKALGIDNKNYSFHSFRKRSITDVLKLTGDIQAAKKKAGHNSIATTEIYLEEVDEEVSGYYSLANQIDPNAYKEASKEDLIKAIESLGKGLIHNLNVKLSNK